MPIDYQQIQSQVKDFGQKAALRQRQLGNMRERAAQLLEQYAARQAELADKVQRAAALNGGLRCAIPTAEAIDPFEGAVLRANGIPNEEDHNPQALHDQKSVAK